MMTGYMAIREYMIDPAFACEFVAAYQEDGSWAKLMAGHEGYLTTELVHDIANPSRFVTIDHWKGEVDWKAFRERFGAEYEELDRQCEKFTMSEKQIGQFAAVGKG